MTRREQIIHYLQNHPDGIDDDALAEALKLPARQQANIVCRTLEREGLVLRRPVDGKINTFWLGEQRDGLPPASVRHKPEPPRSLPVNGRDWFWEGNVQEAVTRHLEAQGFTICSTADTASRQKGQDIIAKRDGAELWVTAKGYPQATARTPATLQAGHWFKQAIFDIIDYRGVGEHLLLGFALPDFPRYRTLAERILWFKPAAGFRYYWVQADGRVVED